MSTLQPGVVGKFVDRSEVQEHDLSCYHPEDLITITLGKVVAIGTESVPLSKKGGALWHSAPQFRSARDLIEFWISSQDCPNHTFAAAKTPRPCL
jgi:hypothetical protein